MQYEFTATVWVDGVRREAGTVLPAAEIPAGCLASLLFTGRVREAAPPHDDPLLIPPTVSPETPAPKPAKKQADKPAAK